MSDSVKVVIKVRPLIKREKDDNLAIQWIVQENSIVSTNEEVKKRGDGRFYFDDIFDVNASNLDVFEIVKPIVNATVSGFNGTVFAYGQTSSGKTYTMMGNAEELGIIPLAVEHMFDTIAKTNGREFLLRVSYLEIYNEKVNDLLNKSGADLKIQEDSSGQLILQCKEEITNSPENVLSIMKKGNKNRRIGETNMNERSSRSHTIFRITIESREVGGDSDSAIQVSQLNLVDLAGSERAKQTGATGERFKEGRHINLSLSTLSLVIKQLSESQDNQKYVNFRDSKLTRLLQNSLGGNAMTAIICAITPVALEETQCTLSFASRAKSVKNKPQINEVMSDAALLKRYAKQIAILQEELQKTKNENQSARVEEMESKLQEKDRINQLLEERIELLKTRIVSGDNISQESSKCKYKRRQTWSGPALFNQHLPVFQSKTDLPTIKEVSFENSRRKSIIQSMDMTNQTFQVAFTDFELELFESERDRDRESISDSEEEIFVTKRRNRVTFVDDVCNIKPENSSFDEMPEKCNIATQTVSYQISPSTPKHVLRRCISDLTKEYVELREFTTLEKQLTCHSCVQEEEKQQIKQNNSTSESYKPQYTSDVEEQLATLQLTEETNLECIITKLCNKLTEIEKRNISKKESDFKTEKQFSELEKRIENIISERDEYEYISRELRAELKKKTTELELKVMSEENIKQEEMKKISELEKQMESIISEKNKFERINVDLRNELTKKVTELKKQIENVTSERNEFENMYRELYVELNKNYIELETLKSNSDSSNIDILNKKVIDLETEIENIMSENNTFKNINDNLRAELNRISLEFESKIASEQTEKEEAIKKVGELEKHIEQVISNKNKNECANNKLQNELNNKIIDLESKIESAYTLKQEAMEKILTLENQIENITCEKNDLERVNNELHIKLKQKVSELNVEIAKQTENEKTREKIFELETQIESITSQKVEYEYINTELRVQLDQKTSALKTEQIENQESIKKISELNKRIETILSERNKFENLYNQLNAKVKETTPELKSVIAEEIATSEIDKQIENITSENNELKLRKSTTNDLQGITDVQTNENLDQHSVLLENESILSSSRMSNADISYLILNMETEKSQLEETLHLKNQELEDIKNDVRSLKTDINKLQETVYLLTTENMEMATKLTTEQENAKQTEFNLKKTIDELYARISEVTNEKITLESDLAALNNRLESIQSKMSVVCNEEQLLRSYQNKIDKLTTENIELSTFITEKNKELEDIKESKSLLYDHDCIYKKKIDNIEENNKYLLAENNELSTDLIDKIEENDMLKEQCNILKSKIEQSLLTNEHFAENDIERVKTENNILKAEIAELKTKMVILSEENTKFSTNLLETIDDFNCSQNENTLHLSQLFNNSRDVSYYESKNEVSQEETRQTLTNKVIALQNKIDYLTCLNKKLSDLKLTSCNQCVHLRNLNESHRILKLEAKNLTQKLEDLQRKFDDKCADTEILKYKMNQESSSSLHVSSNVIFVDEMNVSFIEDRIQSLNDEMQTLKTEHDKFLILYEDKCDELKQFQSDVITAESNTTDAASTSKKIPDRNENRIGQIQNHIDHIRNDIDKIKKNSMNFTAMLNEFKTEKTNLLDQINNLKDTNEGLQKTILNNESTAIKKIQILENELADMNAEFNQFSTREKELESQRLMLEVELESLKREEQDKNSLINQLNEHILFLKNELILVTNEKNELINSSEYKKKELQHLKEQCDKLEKDNVQSKELEQHNISKIKELEAYINNFQKNTADEDCSSKEYEEKAIYLKKLLEEKEQEKYELARKLQTAEAEIIEIKNNAEIRYKNELDSVVQQYQQHIEEYDKNIEKLNDSLNKYIDENLNLTQELTNLRNIQEKLNEIITEKDCLINEQKELVYCNEKLNEELNEIRKCMIRELRSLKYNVNLPEFSNKTVNEIFVILLQTLVLKEGEVIKTMKETYEKEKEKIEEEKKQCLDTEKRTVIWAKELEVEIEKLQTDLLEKECIHKEYQNKIYQLEHLLKESTYENEMFKEKIVALETDFNNLQITFDKQCKIDSQQEEAIFVAQEKEKKVQEIFKNKEIELQSKFNSEKEIYEKKIDNLVQTIESYKIKNLELNNTIEGLEANEKQLKNIVEANSIEIKRNSQNVEKINTELEQVTQAYNEVNRAIEQKNSHIEEITTILKNKCDILSEYKMKLETITPEYEMLKEHVKNQKLIIEQCKEEIEILKKEREKQLEIIKDKLNSEEIKNSGLSKQLNELNNKNVVLIDELNTLKEKYEKLREENARLERRIRNSTSKIKAEAEIEELKELNKRLQNNLEGASNRVKELQEIRNQTLKDLVDVQGKYELLSQENDELKKTVLLCKSKHSTSSLLMDEGKYDVLLLEKNKIALELEDKKIILNRKNKEVEEYVSQIQQLTEKNKELDNEVDEYAEIIRQRDAEISKLEDKLYFHLSENMVVKEIEDKLKNLKEENEELRDQIEAFKMRLQMDVEDDVKLQNESIIRILKKENSELQAKLNSYRKEINGTEFEEIHTNQSQNLDKSLKNKLEESSNHVMELEEERNRIIKELETHKLLLNQKDKEIKDYINKVQDLTMKNKELNVKTKCNATHDEESVLKSSTKKQDRTATSDKILREYENKYEQLKKKIHELELQLVLKNGKIATLEVQIQSENFPYQRKCKELEELVLVFRNKNAELNNEVRQLQKCLNDVNAWECDICRRWRVNRKDQGCQTIPNDLLRFCSTNSGVVEDHVKIQKLEKEKMLMKNLCRSRARQIKELQDRIKELEEAQNSFALRPNEFLQDRCNQ